MKRLNLIFLVFVLSLFFNFALRAQDATPPKVDEAIIADEMAKAAKVSLEAEKAKEEKPSSWSHESELGVALAGGNTDSKTINFKQVTSYEWSRNLLRLDAMFLYGFSDGKKSAEQWLGGLRYERALSEHFSAFLGHNWNGDIFAGYDYRINNDIGVKYYIVPGDKKNNYFFNETGYRFTYEKRVSGSDPLHLNISYIRVYFEGSKSLSEILFLKVWTEFLPDLTDKANLQFNFEPSVGVKLTKYLSLKLGVLGKYDNKPTLQIPALKKFDYLYTTSLVAKF